jgi:membrane-associated phospholipid phosphatase
LKERDDVMISRTGIVNFFDGLNSRLSLEERLTIGMVLLLDLLILVFMRLEQAGDIFVLNVFIVVCILVVNFAHRRFPDSRLQFFRDWYVLPLLIVVYLENRRLIPLINPHDMDDVLIAIDRFLFLGYDPTVLLERLTHPLVSEVLQVAYASFYFLPLTLCLILYLRKPRIEFHINASTILMGFYLSYIGYYFTPVIGPRFTLEHLQNSPLSGVLLFDFVRNLIAQAEGIMRDCCPSGHAMISLLTVLLAWRYARGFFGIVCIWAFLITFSTVYLRYHYVTDLIVGMALGLAVYRWGPGMAEAIIVGDKYPDDSFGMIPCREKESPSR